MSRSLLVGERITISVFEKQIEFLIDEVVGVGGSCIAYRVKYYENENIPHIGILKEYCPAFLDDGSFQRVGTALKIPENLNKQFSTGLDEFKRTYKSINEYLSVNQYAANYHTVQIGLYEGNNTAYTLTSCDYGKSYDKVANESLLSICKIMLSVTKAVELYHNAGYLHLDIKPKNILVLDEVADLVKLFDFDSLTSIEKLKNREIRGVPVPEDYYVPELENYNLRNIGIETDIFEIGAMLFTKVFGRAPEVEDMSYDAEYDIDGNKFFVGISPQAISEFVELLRKTVQISKKSRYATTAELKTKLEKIISLVSEGKPYLINLPKWQPSKYCIGRQEELKEIKKRLDADGYVFIKGIGGLGKSEVAKLYASQYQNEYHTIQFCKYTDSLKAVVATMPVNGIDEQNYNSVETLLKEKNKVLHLADNKTLIIVDNFNVTYDEFLRDFLPSNNQSFKVIFTTRCTMAAEYYESKTYELPKFSMDECKTLFFAHLSAQMDDEKEEIAEELIKFVDYNTLIIILMALSIKKSGIALNEMLSYLEEQKIDSVQTQIFHEYDFSSDEVRAYNKIYAHLSAIFSIGKLANIQKEILKNATLISLNGIGLSEFIENCDCFEINKDSVKDVINLGWLNMDSNNVISMHPIVSDMFSANNELRKGESYYKFAEHLEDFCNPDYCHFSVVLNKLACAKHLERRYVFESEWKQVIIAVKLGRMYEKVYQPNEARKYLKKALQLAESLNLSVETTYIYRFLGDVEKDFGTYTKAIEYYRQCIYEGKKLKNRFYLAVIEAMMSIAECYEDNNNNTKAYNAYLEALNYAKRFKLYDNIYDIADGLVNICQRLNWLEKEKIYKKVSDKYRAFAQVIEEMPRISEFSQKIDEGDFEGGLTAFEEVLAFQREKLGEESPDFKDLKKSLWMYYALNKQKEQAMYLLNESLSFIESSYGKNSVEMAKHLAQASVILIELTEFKEAENFALQAIKICEDTGIVNEYAYVEALFALASYYLLQGKNNDAYNLVKNVDFTEFSGTEFLADVITSCGMVMCQLSRFEEIEPLCKELLQRTRASTKSKYVANIIMAMICEQKGELDKAEAYAADVWSCAEHIKTEHIKQEWLVSYYRIVAKIKSRKGNQKEAIKILTECIDKFYDRENLFLLYSAYSERGLFYFYDNNIAASNEDYKRCEKILIDNNVAEDACIFLYNNISLNYEKCNQLEKAKEYLDKIERINPNVLEPTSFSEAIVCGNIGWIDCNLGNYLRAETLLKKAIATMELLGIDKTYDYFRLKNNLGIVYAKLDDFSKACDSYLSIREKYLPDADPYGKMAIKTSFGIVYSLLKLDRAQEAYDFACNEPALFEKWFGRLSSIRVTVIIQIGGLFKEFGYKDCYDFFFLAEDLITESKDFKSLNNARLLNYMGVYWADEMNEYGKANLCFQDSKKLFEELNATEDDMYPIVVKNIEYVEKLLIDDLIKQLAESMSDSEEEDL